MRIVSLVPSHTEILFALGLGDCVVGVTEHCDYPPAALQINKIGTFAYPEPEQILSLRPDLVLAGGRIHNNCTAELRRVGVNVYDFEPGTVNDIFLAMEEITELTGQGESGRLLVVELRERLARIKENCTNVQRSKIVFVMGENEIMTPGPASCQYDALCILGAVPFTVDENISYVSITWQDITGYNPDIILSCGSSPGEPIKKRCPGCNLINRPCVRDIKGILNNPLLEKVKAIQNGRVYAIPCHFLCRTGPRLIYGMEQLSRLIG